MSLVRKHVPDSDPGWMFAVIPATHLVIPAKAGIQRRGGRRTRATLSRYGQFRHNLRSLFDHNLQTRRTNYAQI